MKNRLEQILAEHFSISREDFDEAKKTAREQGSSTGSVLVRKNLLLEDDWLKALAIQFSIPLSLSGVDSNIRTDFTSKVSIQFLKKHLMIPLESADGLPFLSLEPEEPEPDTDDTDRNEESVTKDYEGEQIILLHDPSYVHSIDDLAAIAEFDSFRLVLAPRNIILAAINTAYDKNRDSAQQLVADMEEDDGSAIIKEIEATSDLLEDTSNSPIIKLVNHIISQSIKARASDIHIEPFQDHFKVRYRVDGILYDLLTPGKMIQAPLISRIKVMAKLDIAEKRLPQDGRIEVRIGEIDIDIRVSTIPTAFGERVVLRLLNKSGMFLKLDQFGIDTGKIDTINSLINLPNGIILVTGPTGSGKTTTLYAILARLNSSEKNIITIEDPVEYQIEGIGQIQVNRKINLTFARGLRSIVRQDPDVILVGEIRDGETAEISVQSALTGHLVFSTLHTNDSASAVTRLVEFGVEPFLITSAVKAVVAQRLVRVLCSECREAYTPDEATITSLGLSMDMFAGKRLYRARGCPSCIKKGYRGRVPIFEIMVLDNSLKKTVLNTSDSNIIKDRAVDNGMVTLREDGLDKVLQGMTTIEEVLRVTA